MNYRLAFLFLIAGLTGCQTAKQAVMTQDGFGEITIGTTADQIIERYGEPYTVTTISRDTYEYEYIERWSLGKEVVVQRRFYLTVKDGEVVDKRMTSSKPPAYNAIYTDDPTSNY